MEKVLFPPHRLMTAPLNIIRLGRRGEFFRALNYSPLIPTGDKLRGGSLLYLSLGGRRGGVFLEFYIHTRLLRRHSRQRRTEIQSTSALSGQLLQRRTIIQNSSTQKSALRTLFYECKVMLIILLLLSISFLP
jgi:hypothetical protein